ncbi:MAG: hypothetical protein ACHQ2Z_06835 [Elusimicrobiota bacterium]
MDTPTAAAAYYTIHAKHLDSTGSSAGWPADGVVVCGPCTDAAFSSQLDPTLVGDGAGGMVVSWTDYDASFSPTTYAQRYNSSGSALWGGGSPLVVSNLSGSVFKADDGTIFLLNDMQSSTDIGAYVQELNLATGAALLSPSYGVFITSIPLANMTGFGSIVSDGVNGFYFPWADNRTGNSVIYSVRVVQPSPGAVSKSWELPLISAPPGGGVPGAGLQDAADGGGGLFVVWLDTRNTGPYFQAFGTNVDGTGSPKAGWTTGVSGGSLLVVSTMAFGVNSLAAYKGDMLITGLTFSPSGYTGPGFVDRIFAQRVSGGVRQWGDNGVTLDVQRAFPTGSAPLSLSIYAGLPIVTTSADGNTIFAAWGTTYYEITSAVTLRWKTYIAGQALDGTGKFLLTPSPLLADTGAGVGTGGVIASTGVYLGAIDPELVNDFIFGTVPGNLSPDSFLAGVPSNSGSAIFVWQDIISNPIFANKNILAQKLDATPVPQPGGGGNPPAPTNVKFTAVSTTSLTATWDLATGSSYLMALSSTPSFSTTLSSGTGGLNQNTTTYAVTAGTFYFKVKISTNPDSAYSAAISTTVAGPAPAPTGVPPAPTNVNFTVTTSTSLMASWDLVTGNSYLMVLSSTPSFSTTLSSGTGVLNQNTTTYAVTAGSYYFKVKISTNPDASYSAAISTTIAATIVTTTAPVSVPGSSTTVTVSTTAPTSVTLAPASGPITVTAPVGAFGSAANTLTATIPKSVPPASSGSSGVVTPLGPAVSLTLATPVAHFTSPVSLAIAIPPQTNTEGIYLAWYDEALGAWWPLWESYFDAILEEVLGETWHFTTFAAVRVKFSSNLDNFKVFPNPVNFVNAARGTIKFMGLTAQATIKIYTVTGELVKTISPGTNGGGTVNDGVSGLAEWNGRNDNGSFIARGTYIYYVTDPSGGKKKGLIGVTK